MAVRDVNLRKEFGTNIIAIENKGSVIDNVDPDYKFKDGDILFISGSKKGLNHMLEWAENNYFLRNMQHIYKKNPCQAVIYHNGHQVIDRCDERAGCNRRVDLDFLEKYRYNRSHKA